MKNRRTILAAAVLGLLLMMGCTVFAGENGEYKYELKGDYAAIVAYLGSAENVIVPDMLEGLPVTEIWQGAFYGNETLRTLEIPGTVTYIGGNDSGDHGAFQNCTRLEQVVLKPGTKDATVGYSAFKGCTSLRSVLVPGNYTRIDYQAFKGCILLESAKWETGTYDYPNQTLGSGAFQDCTALKSAELPGTVLTICDNAFRDCTSLDTLTLGEGTKELWQAAFAGCTALKNVTIPSTVIYIGGNDSGDKGAFQGCTRLETVKLKAGTEDAVLGYNSFRDCPSLLQIVIPGNYISVQYCAFNGDISLRYAEWKRNDYIIAKQTLGTAVFKGCTALETVILPDTLTTIQDEAFRGCESLTFLLLEEGLESVWQSAFTDCTALEEVCIPSTVTYLGGNDSGDKGAFQGCKRLKNVWFLPGKSDAVVGYNCFRDCLSLGRVVIPGNYAEVQYCAFNGDISLTSAWLGNSGYAFQNQKIGKSAFQGCTALQNVSLPETIVEQAGDAFPAEQGILFSVSSESMPQDGLLEAQQAQQRFRETAESLRLPDDTTWTCSQGHSGNTGLFCPLCGEPKPEE